MLDVKQLSLFAQTQIADFTSVLLECSWDDCVVRDWSEEGYCLVFDFLLSDEHVDIEMRQKAIEYQFKYMMGAVRNEVSNIKVWNVQACRKLMNGDNFLNAVRAREQFVFQKNEKLLNKHAAAAVSDDNEKPAAPHAESHATKWRKIK